MNLYFLLPFLILFIPVAFAQSVNIEDGQGIISSDLQRLEAINQKINNYMYDTVPNYNADQWGTITEHPTQKGMYILDINSDSRNPLDSLSVSEKNERIPYDAEEWKIKKDGGR